MKRLNVRLILTLLMAVVVFGVGAICLQRWQVNRHAQGLLRRAELARHDGDRREAISLIGRYLQQRPNDGDALKQMAELIEETTREGQVERRQYSQAQQILEKAIRFAPDDADLRRRAIDFYTRFRRFNDAADHIEYLLKNGHGKDSQLQYQHAQALIGAAKLEQGAAQLAAIVGYSHADGDFDASRATDASNIEAYHLLATIQRRNLSQPELADRTMEQCVAANDRAAAAYLARGSYLLLYHRDEAPRREQAKDDFRKAAELAPDDPAAISAAADLELQVGNYDAAKKWADVGMRDFPDRDVFYQIRAQAALRQRQPDEAMRFVEAGLRNIADSRPLLLIRADLDLAAGDLSRVNDTAELLQSDDRYHVLGEYLAAQVLYRKRSWRAASEALNKALRELTVRRPDLAPRAYLMLAECYENLNQPDRQRAANGRAQSALESLYRHRGGDARTLALIHFSEARASLRLGQLDAARKSIETAKRIAAAGNIDLPAMQRWETTLLAAEERKKPPESRDIAAIEQRFLEGLDQRDDMTPAQRTALHARFLMQHGQTERAKKLLGDALAGAPSDKDLLLARVDLAQLSDGMQEAARLLEEAQSSLGDTVEIRLRMALLHSVPGDEEATAKLHALEEDAGHFSTAEKTQLWRGLGAVHLNIGRVEDALRLWRRVAKAQPDELSIRLSMFEAAQLAGDADTMADLSREIQAIDGRDGPYWKFVEARRLLSAAAADSNGDAAQAARRLAEEAQADRPNWHALSLLLADLDIYEGNVDSAIEHLQAALAQGPAAPRTIRKLVELLWSQKRFDESLAAMDELSKTGESAPQDVRLRSRAESATGDLQQAVALAKAAAKDSQQASDHLWLARLLARQGHADEAVASYRRAVQLSPEDEQARLALLRQLILMGDRKAAESEIRGMKLYLPQQRADSVLGIAYEMLGENLLAKAHFEQALAARPDDPLALRDVAAFHLLNKQQELALVYIDRMLRLAADGEDAAPQQFAWARRTKARLIGGTGRYADYRKAVALLGANAQADAAMAAMDLIALADLTLPRKDPLAVRAAIEQFNKEDRQRRLSAAERVALARLHEAAGDWPHCEEIMTTLLSDEPTNEAALRAWCQMKLVHGATGGMESLLRQLDDASPRVKQLRARLHALEGRPQRAADLVRELVPPPDSKNRPAAVAALARLLEEMGLNEEAEKYHRAAAGEAPEGQLRLAEFLVRIGKYDEALRICERQMRVETAIPVTRIGIMALTAQRGELPLDAPAYAQVDRWLQAGLRELPDSKMLTWHRVLFEELRGDYEKIIPLYRSYLERNDLDFRERAVADNNLAMVLAGRGQPRQAKMLIDEAIELVGPTVPMLDTRAVVALGGGQAASAARAADDLELAAAMDEDPVLRFHLALARQQAGDGDAARQALQAALDGGLNPNTLSALERPRYDALARSLELNRQSRRTLQPQGVGVR